MNKRQKHNPAKDFALALFILMILFFIFGIVGTMEARNEATKNLYNYDPTTNTKTLIRGEVTK